MELTITQLREILEERKRYAEDLQKRLAQVLEDLVLIEEDLVRLEGGNARPKRKRGRKKAKKAGKGVKPEKKAAKRGRPPGKKTARKGKSKARKKGEKKLAEYAIEALEAAGTPVSFPELAKAVEALGYESKNTTQVLRLMAGKGKKFVVEGDSVSLSG